MSLKKGLKQFGKDGADAVVKELRQLDYLDVIDPVNSRKLSREEWQKALSYHMYLKEKRCGRIKPRGCADGRKQGLYNTKEETSSPTVSLEAQFLTSAINVQEWCQGMRINIASRCLHACWHQWTHPCMPWRANGRTANQSWSRQISYIHGGRTWKESVICWVAEGTIWDIASCLIILAEPDSVPHGRTLIHGQSLWQMCG